MEAFGDLLPAFITSNCAQCFTHILSLIAKSLLKQFDVKTKLETDDGLNEEEQGLLDLAEDLEAEELIMAQENDEEDGEIDEDDDLGDWVDKVAALTPEEQETLKDSIRPIKMVLVKLRKLAFKIVHSSTILLPAWKTCLEDLELVLWIMPRDVTTQWNSTFDMLSFAVKYQGAIE
ncbi:hypothetical protein L208DRAFT_1334794 [Tricholoma matsutake]|nr:hypothetical protein L208DRAFT_1334794 [Tricholoma matsutake 945]